MQGLPPPPGQFSREEHPSLTWGRCRGPPAADSGTSLVQHPQGVLGGWGQGLRLEGGVPLLIGRAPPWPLTRHTLPSECCPGSWPLAQCSRRHRAHGQVVEMPLKVITSTQPPWLLPFIKRWLFTTVDSLAGSLQLHCADVLSTICPMRKLRLKEAVTSPRSHSEVRSQICAQTVRQGPQPLTTACTPGPVPCLGPQDQPGLAWRPGQVPAACDRWGQGLSFAF